MSDLENIKSELSVLFEKWANEKPKECTLMPESGSNRKYFILSSDSKKAVGAYNPDKRENIAFLTLSEHFNKFNLNVPKIYNHELDKNIYLQQYLGENTLYSFITSKKDNNRFDDEVVSLYKDVISELPKFQINAGKNIDYKICYPREAFDKQSMMWDLNYFKYYFLRLAGIQFDEQLLENDFETFTNYLLKADCNYFLYRDFQSRNIMISDNKPYFIDYQGGRKGALQYDIASLLYDAKADIPEDIRNMLLEHYINVAEKIIKIDRNEFKGYYQGYSLIRIMQAMGAYGFRGFYEKKSHFLQSIPFAVSNINNIIKNLNIPVKIPTLLDVLNKIILSESLKAVSNQDSALSISINSFSYKRAIPYDESGNGGGFVFDCRAINNPGIHEEFRNITGKSKQVIDMLDNEPEMASFLKNVFALIDQSVNKYQKRGFSNLMISFGCTGGQHRSVYSAEKLAQHLKEKYNVKINVRHRELEINKL